MNRRMFAIGCLALASAGAADAAQVAAAVPSPTRWGRLRRKLMRSHMAVLLIGGALVGIGAWCARPRGSRPDRIPPWERH
jgi:hypothetical protein